ncbi:MAG: hypothetical protein WC383_04635 [Gammaproteobacteria bacterium]
MIWHLIAVIIIGLSVGGIMFMLRKLSGNRLPKWLISASAGAAMIGYLAYYDYTWYEFKSGLLPEGTTIIETQRSKSFFRPWSYISAPVNAFTVFDGRSKKVEQDGQILVEYFLYTFRKEPLERLETHSYLMNCRLKERVIFDKAEPNSPIKMERVDRSDQMYLKLCL